MSPIKGCLKKIELLTIIESNLAVKDEFKVYNLVIIGLNVQYKSLFLYKAKEKQTTKKNIPMVNINIFLLVLNIFLKYKINTNAKYSTNSINPVVEKVESIPKLRIKINKIFIFKECLIINVSNNKANIKKY